MITVNSIGGGTLSAAVVAEKSQGTQQIAPAQDLGADDLGASIAAYMSLPGFNAAGAVGASNDTATDTQADGGQAAALQAVSDSDDDGLKQALKEFDDGLKSLSQRPEAQVFRAKFGAEPLVEGRLPPPPPLPGVQENGLLNMPGSDRLAADTNHDGKVSEEELRRYQEPLTYRAIAGAGRLDALADGPSAFSLVEANRAYGVVSAAAATA
ncbi:hypothetical protein ASF61_05030 [Duganella sp. Leaf126]|uniref:hypothetical protein n=1 Tax=Duganella sp. Leaf126 TaxID=1736266 RepID=UPI0006FDA5FE|nr:hypothetical protein [Duganella sp. Leaf126]KQQ40152.1 hypothetical protein ASF61_05030 [Duganella sp. Leaf126]